METKANYALIGIFTIAGFLGLLGFLVWFAKLELNRQFAYYDIHFPEVTGLGIASEVRFAGLPVGTVVDMRLSPGGDGSVRVRIEVTEDTPVRSDSRASIEAQGVTGVSNVAISAGSGSAPLLREVSDQPVPVIASSRSALQTLSDQGPEIISRLNTVAEQLTALLGEENQTRVRNILDNIEHSSGNLDQAMTDIASATEAIGVAAEGIAAFGNRIEGLAEAAEVTLGNADTALTKFTDTAARADVALQSGTAALDEVQLYVSGDLRQLTQRLDETAAALQTDLSELGQRADQSLDRLDVALDAGTRTLGSAERAFDGADRVINTDLGPVIADLRRTLGNLDEAIARVSADLPEITGRLREAADAAGSAFGGLNSMLDGARGPVQSFTRDALPQFTRVSAELRGLVENVNQLVTALRRNPTQIFTGPRAPEFRR